MRDARSPRSSSYCRLPKFSMTALQALMKSGGGTSGMGFSWSGVSPSMALAAFSGVPATNKFSRGVKASSSIFSRSAASSARSNLRIKAISLEEACLSFSSAARSRRRFITSAGPMAPASRAWFSLTSSNNKKDSSIWSSRHILMMAPSILIGSPMERTVLSCSVAFSIRLDCSTARASRRATQPSSPSEALAFKTLTNCASKRS
mmetsp:Transcript_24071/g.66724  ORF Transcript_24071/g.66724 Transcript_24071/m.66724 type:complete len:205 (+) Transcript_24071:404-1018(+)